jgi:hypothetical protein
MEATMKTTTKGFELKDAKKMAELFADRMRTIIESGESAIPIAASIDLEGSVQLHGFDLELLRDASTKENLGLLCQQLAQQPTVRFFIFLADSWVKIVDKQEFATLDMSKGVRTMPGRKEAISVTLYDARMQKTLTGYWEYDRDAANRPVFSEKFKWSCVGDIVNSRFSPADKRMAQ